ncbi:cupin-like domain-containing protein [Luteimonas sp. SJ-92]|uniref:Cupin-like domain-containing protein n=1 Tax=Luteimonas salinisoli TaxID=2752307 RepID=A0A853JJX0_9GAMM|nr:cupin-like domain-containing protein [Luteimonas salinisoli]NZA28670.1 cupin-like domain-containing protein [Luteimonas salinisoli]
MLPAERAIAEIDCRGVRAPPDEALCAFEPVVLRGLAGHWPLVRAAADSPRAAVDYLARFERKPAPPVVATVGPPEIDGRFFYSDDLQGFNFRREKMPLGAVLDSLLEVLPERAPPAIYVASTTIDTWLPGLRDENDIDLGDRAPLASIWIGNRTRIAAHQDLPDNLACVAAGRRRVTLFPPDQLRNLYIGPLDFTLAGQPVSLVDFAAPDLDRFPRFAEALGHARTAELGPGDAVLIPSMWWHHMEALDGFNVLVNYWWRRSPAWMDTPMNALMLALMSVRDLPPQERATWQEVFRHYVFEPGEATDGHIPEAARRVLAPLDDTRARELRARLLQRLNR